MTRAALVAVCAALAVPGTVAAAGFDLGVAAGEVTATSAQLWTRAPRAGVLRVEASTNRRFRGMPIVADVVARPADDRTAHVRLVTLRPGTRYFYRFRQGSTTSAVGSFVTAPRANAAATVEFAISGDADASRRPGQARPAFNEFQVYARMAAEGNHFNVNLGDTIYSDSSIPGTPPALTTAAKWAKYRQNLGLANLRRLRAATGLYSHWDDHEFVNDFSRPEFPAVFGPGVAAFLDYAPVRWSARDGLYRTFRWGRHLELFFLDERSFRSAKVAAACNGDLAPTAPQAVRDAFASLVPSLASPVPQACLDAIRDPRRTMLGARQYAAFTRAIARSTATWKVVVNETPIMQFYALPYDRWEGYEAERVKLLEFLRGVRNVVFLTTDTHANFIHSANITTLGPNGVSGTPVWEVVTGPVATNTYSAEVDGLLGAPGTATAITALFFKPLPPRGVGMTCAAPNVYSYAQVRVTAATLTVTPKDLRGQRVREETGAPCGPLVLRAR